MYIFVFVFMGLNDFFLIVYVMEISRRIFFWISRIIFDKLYKLVVDFIFIFTGFQEKILHPSLITIERDLESSYSSFFQQHKLKSSYSSLSIFTINLKYKPKKYKIKNKSKSKDKTKNIHKFKYESQSETISL